MIGKGQLNRIQGMHAQAVFVYRHPEGHPFRAYSSQYYAGQIDALANVLSMVDPDGTYQTAADVHPFAVGAATMVKVPACSAPIAAIAVGDKTYITFTRLVATRHLGEQIEILLGQRTVIARELIGGFERI